MSGSLNLLRAIVTMLILTCSFSVSAGSAKAQDLIADWPTKWMAKGLADHPLVGKIFVSHTKRFIEPKSYLRSLAWPRFVLLGEIHDNPDHHRLQALAVRALNGGRTLSVVFEHFRTDQQGAIDAFQSDERWMKSAGGDDQIARLFDVTAWKTSGWPDPSIYRPLMQAVLARDAKILAGNAPRKRVFEIAQRGLEMLGADTRRRFALDRPLGRGDNATEDLDDALLKQLEESHCGLMPKSAFGNMAIAQRFRDGHMARVMVDATLKDGPVALVAGNGHVHRSRGVPWYIAKMLPVSDDRPMIVVGHVEVVASKLAPTDYADALKAFSVIVFTPRQVRPDPCMAMRKRFGKPSKSKP